MTPALTPYQEAQRYIKNAKDTLKEKTVIKDGNYSDVKYVRTAAGTAYVGVLIALDEYLLQKEGSKYKKPKSIEDYRTRLAKHNKKLVVLLNDVYGLLHLSLYYHGVPSVDLMKIGLSKSLEIIEFIK
jgi:hypothetical protein